MGQKKWKGVSNVLEGEAASVCRDGSEVKGGERR